ncbi:MAG: YibE/F family protein [Clostridia bacterium]|jgi:uncharacterized membrane protein|nr:YibE/F family protein [Clostridia bacterium]
MKKIILYAVMLFGILNIYSSAESQTYKLEILEVKETQEVEDGIIRNLEVIVEDIENPILVDAYYKTPKNAFEEYLVTEGEEIIVTAEIKDEKLEIQELFREVYLKGKVINTKELPVSEYEEGLYKNEELEILVLSGPIKGEKIYVGNNIDLNLPYDFFFDKGEKAVIYAEYDLIKGQYQAFYIQDRLREDGALMMTAVFLILLIVIGGIKGFKSIITLALTILIVMKGILPAILAGYNPIWVSIISSIIIIIMTLAILDWFNVKTISAMIGTSLGVALAGLISVIVGNYMHLTGLGLNEATMLVGHTFDFKALLFASIIISALGAVMDVSMSIASSMDEVKRANPSISIKDLIKSGMNVGRDIMGTMSNTLILVYTGSSITVMLIFLINEMDYTKIINLDLIGSDIVSALSGSIGLILTIPITAVTAGLLEDHYRNKKKEVK